MNKMKTLTLQGVQFEVVDEQARASIPEKIVQAINGVEPDENGNVNIEISGGVSSWNDLTDKPFYETVEIIFEWDGDVSNREPVYEDGEEYKLYKVGDEPPALTDFSGIKIVGSNGTIIDVTDDIIYQTDYGYGVGYYNDDGMTDLVLEVATNDPYIGTGLFVLVSEGMEFLTKVVRSEVITLDPQILT